MAFLRYALADRLHKTLDEIDAMSVSEFEGWFAYFKVDEKRRKRRGKRGA